MKIDSLATKGRFAATGRKFEAWARANGHNAGTLKQLLSGRIPVPKNLDTPSGRIIADLKRDDLLVEQKDIEEAAA